MCTSSHISLRKKRSIEAAANAIVRKSKSWEKPPARTHAPRYIASSSSCKKAHITKLYYHYRSGIGIYKCKRKTSWTLNIISSKTSCLYISCCCALTFLKITTTTISYAPMLIPERRNGDVRRENFFSRKKTANVEEATVRL